MKPIEYDDHAGKLIGVDCLDFLQELFMGLQRRDPDGLNFRAQQIAEIRGDFIQFAHSKTFHFVA
ncbi:MAG: hypothetical protein ACSW77_06955, partial [Bacteroidales bacterium]